MSDDRLTDSDKRLEQVIDALRDQAVPEGPDTTVREQLLGALAAADSDQLSTISKPYARSIAMRVFGLATSVLIVAAVVGWIASLSNLPGGTAFAQMLAQVNDVRTAMFTTQVEVSGRPMAMQGKTMLLEPDWQREEMIEGKTKTVIIFDLKGKKSLTLNPAAKQAVLRSMMGEADVRPKNILEQIQEVQESSAEVLGNERMDGIDAVKYRCDAVSGHFLLWLDPKTKLPIKVVVTESGGDSKFYVTITYSDFQWNVPLDKSLFTLDVPAGYELQQGQLSKSEPSMRDLIATMKVFVRLNNNEFPDEYNALTPGSIVQFLDDPSLPPEERMANYRRKLAQALERPDLENANSEVWNNEGKEVGRIFARGAVYLQVLAQTHDWHYVGKGVKLGEADKIVAWWAPKKQKGDDAKAEATVLFGDLHTEQRPVAGLPTAAQ